MNPTTNMNTVTQYFPAFMDMGEPEVVQYDTLEDLLNIDWVKKFSTIDDFYRFSSDAKFLMIERRGGEKWYVIGILDKPEDRLPKPEFKSISVDKVLQAQTVHMFSNDSKSCRLRDFIILRGISYCIVDIDEKNISLMEIQHPYGTKTLTRSYFDGLIECGDVILMRNSIMS
jgi:hypothetical protein